MGMISLKKSIMLEFAGSQKGRDTDANLEKEHFGGSREMRRNMELG
jgi:hypothetical protein